MKMNKKVLLIMIVMSLFIAGLMLAGNGNGNGNGNGGGGGSNAGNGPADGTGYGPGDGTGTQPGDGTGFGAGGSENAGGYGPGDCQEIAQSLNSNQAYSAEEIAEAFGLQVEQVYKLMNEGILKTIRSQNQLKVLGSEIQEKVNEIAKLFE